MKQEYVLLAQTYKPTKYMVAGWLMSEKLDGKRAWWDGGIGRNRLATDVPWANTVKDKKPKIATGLWTRSGKVIHAPNWWLDTLPKIPLDGELWTGRGRCQFVLAATSRHIPIDYQWEQIEYKVFDSPINLTDRTITVRDYKFEIRGALEWAASQVGVTYPKEHWNFELIQSFLRGRVKGPYASIVKQSRVPYANDEAIEAVHTELDEVAARGGEGLMLRKPESIWTPIRSHYLLKYKPWKFGEGRVVGYQHGIGKLQGLMGALILDFDGKRLEISGFTNHERDYGSIEGYTEANKYPGTIATKDICNHQFPRDMVVKFKYTELSDDGIPLKAGYKR